MFSLQSVYPLPKMLVLILCISAPCWSQSSASSSSACSSSSAASNGTTTPALQCTVNSSQPWEQGYNATVEVTNISPSPLEAWQVYLQMAQGHTINHYWNAEVAPGNGTATASNAHWNGQLQPGQSTSFGILGSHPGEYIAPLCSVSPLPQAELNVQSHGTTIKASAIGTDANLAYNIDFGDGASIPSATAWHTYAAAGQYDITLTASDGEQQSSQTQTITVMNSGNDNSPPVAKLFYDVSSGNVSIASGLSYDPDGDPLTKTSSHTQSNGYRTQVLTVFDGELGDTTAAYISTRCDSYYHASIELAYDYTIADQTLAVDARNSVGAHLVWDFGDGHQSTDVVTQHNYNEPGDYQVSLSVYGIPHREVQSFNVHID
ncbi:PKD domain-containing protein [Gilvimarinus japonicus]|uniref:PKD domain-containing protein n=1 Tax=Gilvimarinus japonicus TaxID=1796469 RepID=A0ABV7HL32_9GAMM